MPSKTIQIKLEIDGREAIATLNQADLNLDKFISKTKGLKSTGKQGADGVNSMNHAVGQFGWILGDANMFMVNFRMGMMSVANNIPMFVQAFAQALETIKETGGTLKSALVGSLMGPGGVMLAVNALMFALQVLPQLFGETTKEMKEQKEETKKLADEYKKLSKVQIDAKIRELQSQYETNKELLWLIENRKKTVTTSVPKTADGPELDIKTVTYQAGDKKIREETLKDMKRIEDQIKSLGDVSRVTGQRVESILNGTARTKSINDIKEQISDLSKEFEYVGTAAERAKFQKRIKELEDLRDKWETLTAGPPDRPIIDFETAEPEDIEILEMSPEELERLKIDNIDNEFERQRALAEFQYQMELKKYEDYANFTEIKAQLDEKHSQVKRELSKTEAEVEIEARARVLTALAGMFNKNTVIGKAALIARATQSTYAGAAAALEPPPVGAGPLLGPILAGITIASGLAQVGRIAGITQPKMPGYARGGAVIGENGPEIIAPMQDYASGQAKLIDKTVLAVKASLSGQGAGNVSSQEIKALRNDLRAISERPISGNLIIGNKTAGKIYTEGKNISRGSKL